MTFLRSLFNLHLKLFYIPIRWPVNNIIQIRSHTHKEINKINTLTKSRREFKKITGFVFAYFNDKQTHRTVLWLLCLSCQQYLSFFVFVLPGLPSSPNPSPTTCCISVYRFVSYHLPNLHSKMACLKRLLCRE